MDIALRRDWALTQMAINLLSYKAIIQLSRQQATGVPQGN